VPVASDGFAVLRGSDLASSALAALPTASAKVRGALAVVSHPGHKFLEVRARVSGQLVTRVPEVVKVKALQADSGQRRQPDAAAETGPASDGDNLLGMEIDFCAFLSDPGTPVKTPACGRTWLFDAMKVPNG